MTSRWLGTLRFAVAALSVVVFVVGAHLAATALIDLQRGRQMQEINEVAMRRAEVAIDHGLATLDDLAQQTAISCADETLQAVRLHVYQHWAVKDIRIANHDGTVACSAYPETLEFDRTWVKRDDMLPARDQSVRLFRVDQFFGSALGVFKDVNAEHSLIAILTVNASLFDLMPRELREHSEVALELANGHPVAGYSPIDREGPMTDAIEFVTTAERYPLRTVVRVDAQALAQWHRESYIPILGLGLLLGLGFGVLLASTLFRPLSPIARIDRALAAREFQPYMQPVVDLLTGAVTGCEVLARWVQSDGTVIPPFRFIQLAESSGRIEPMTWQLLASALNDLRELMAQDKTFKLSINIMPRHLVSPGFIDDVRRVVSEARVSPRQIVLEITEREELADLDQAAAVVNALRDLGFKIAIDDVGIGHSGLSHIQRLSANTLKIDKFFTDSVTRDQSAVTVIEMLVRLAHELKMSVIAEGIESKDQVASLIECGVTEGQGFIYAPPLPAPEFLAFIERRRSAGLRDARLPARVA